MESIYNKDNKVVSVQQKKKDIIVSIIICLIILIIVMLVSCQFKFGLLVIGSDSMFGTINKGDIILYERYDEDDKIETGDIIVFLYEDTKIVHRIEDQRLMGAEMRYYTKGDANIQKDDGYRKREDIIGKVKFRIPYIGYLTLWINNLIENGGK